jgi:hypothetical protein
MEFSPPPVWEAQLAKGAVGESLLEAAVEVTVAAIPLEQEYRAGAAELPRAIVFRVERSRHSSWE